jgi:hypothetical protein
MPSPRQRAALTSPCVLCRVLPVFLLLIGNWSTILITATSTFTLQSKCACHSGFAHLPGLCRRHGPPLHHQPKLVDCRYHRRKSQVHRGPSRRCLAVRGDGERTPREVDHWLETQEATSFVSHVCFVLRGIHFRRIVWIIVPIRVDRDRSCLRLAACDAGKRKVVNYRFDCLQLLCSTGHRQFR